MDASQLLRVSFGFLLAPAIGLAVPGVLLCAGHPTQSFTYCLPGVGLIVGVGALIAYPAAVLLGIPAFLICRRHGWLRFWQVAVAATLVGILSSGGILLTTDSGIISVTQYVPLSGAVGLVSGVAFWAMVLFRNRALTPGSRDDAPPVARA